MPAAFAQPGPFTDHTGFQPIAAPQPRSRRRAAHADVAQHSAMPYSAMPHSAAPHAGSPYSPAPRSAAPHSSAAHSVSPYAASPYAAAQAAAQYSAVPYSAVPYSAMPYSAVPNSGSPYSIAPRTRAVTPPVDRVERKPEYRDDLTSTSSSLPRALYPEYDQPASPAGSYGRQDPYAEREAYAASGRADEPGLPGVLGHGPEHVPGPVGVPLRPAGPLLPVAPARRLRPPVSVRLARGRSVSPARSQLARTGAPGPAVLTK